MTRLLTVAAATVALALPATAAMAQKVGETRAASLAAVEGRFKSIDKDRDGTVTMTELTTFLQKNAADNGETMPPKRPQRVMRSMDANGDQSSTLDEFKTLAGERFTAMDTNKNGKIEPAEAAAAKAAAPQGGMAPTPAPMPAPAATPTPAATPMK